MKIMPFDVSALKCFAYSFSAPSTDAFLSVGSVAAQRPISFYPVASDKDEIFIRTVLQKPGENKKLPVLVAFDKKGKELRRYEGAEGSRKGFCVTDKYVIFIDPNGNFRVFEKKTAKKLGEGKLTFGAFALCTVKGNTVIAYDESSKKLYRIDF